MSGTAKLFGREEEAGVLASLIEGVSRRGAALIVRGEAGIGKSALLGQTSAAARQTMLVLTAAGAQSEANLAFAGLHQLLRPVLTRHSTVDVPESPVLRAAFGAAGTTAPGLYQIALATLDLLSDAAARTPVLLIAEDAHWLDRPTCDVLAFVGRRLESDSVVLLAAIRDGYDSPLIQAGLPELRLRGLTDESARALLTVHFPDLPPSVREKTLGEAGGNPLALMELPEAARHDASAMDTALPGRLPLTARLERAFAARAAELPASARLLLRIASADDSGELAEIMQAARIVGDVAPSMDDLAAAVSAHLIEVDGTSLRFRHPLVRSAVYQAASIAERQAVHAALAEALADDLERRVWHRAAATVSKDPAIAAELEETARRASDRGALMTAAAAFERAADFSADPAQRGARLLLAATAASELGRVRLVQQLLRQADALQLGEHERALSMWLGDPFRPGWTGDPVRIRELVATGCRLKRNGDAELALRLLVAAAVRCQWADMDEDVCAEVLRAADEMAGGQTGGSRSDSRLLLIQALAAPLRRGAAVITGLPTVPPEDPEELSWLGTAACLTGDYRQSSQLLAAATVRAREQGRLRLLTQLLHIQGWSAFMTAGYPAAMMAAEEAERLTVETGQPLGQAGAWTVKAAVGAVRGEEAVTEKLTAEAERVTRAAGVASLLGLGQYARGLLALGQGRHADAFDHLGKLFQPGDPARHRQVQCIAIGDFTEAATRSGNRDQAVAAVDLLAPLIAQTPSPGFDATMLYARALLADDEDGYARALGQDLACSPFYRARLQLAYGEWLRRQRRVAQSRVPLRAARDALDAIGAVPWAERARQELRAAGESSRRPRHDVFDQLSPQELQIVVLVAEGLTNRAIAQRLYLSHRTVESHLYRIFPKLGVSSRAQLAEALEARPALK